MKKIMKLLSVLGAICFLAVLGGCNTGGGTGPVLDVTISGETTVAVGQFTTLKADVTYTGSRTLEYQWYVGITHIESITVDTFKLKHDSAISNLPIKVVVSDGTLNAEATITVTWQ